MPSSPRTRSAPRTSKTSGSKRSKRAASSPVSSVGRRASRWFWSAFLTPLAVGCLWTLLDLVRLSGNQLGFWIPYLCGVVSWLILFLTIPSGRWMYVLGHELTHALAALMSGGKVRSLRIHSSGGEVVVTRANSLVVLAPYFFPFYSMLWLFGWWTASWIVDIQPWKFGFFWGCGMTYAFHVIWTGRIIRQRQPDLEREGWVFSGVLIVAIHGLLAVVTLTWLTEAVNLATALGWVTDRAWYFLLGIWRLLQGSRA